MQYPYLTLLEIITLFLTLAIGTIIFYFLIKKGRETKFSTAIKAIALYELISLVIYLIYPASLLPKILHNNNSELLNLLILGVILFFIFHFVMKKILSTNWKKTIISFLLVIIIIFPFLNFLRVFLIREIITFPVFSAESTKMETELKAYFEEYGFGALLSDPVNPPLPGPSAFKVTGVIERATLSWPTENIAEILLNLQR